MARRFATATLRCFLMTLALSGGVPTLALAQNLLDNGDFETGTVPNYGDNVGVTLQGWMRSHENPAPTAQAAYQYRELSVVKVDGPGGQPLTLYNSPYGQIAPTNLPEEDVTHAGTQTDGHYIRLNTKHYWSVLGQRFSAPHTGCIAFGGAITGSYVSTDLFRFGSINPFFGGVATNPDATYAMDNTVTIGNDSVPFVANQWTLLQDHYPVDAGEQYAWAFVLRPGFTLDDAFAHYVDNSYCPTIQTGTPNAPSAPAVPALDPSDISLTKSCTPASSAEHNGQVGQMWECSVDVTVPSAPFAGSLSVSDLYTPISTTASEVISATSASGGFDCTTGASCTIDGADFAANGTDTLDFAIFVTNTELQDTYPMQNCVEGSYDDGTGAITPVAGNCVDAQWIPRSSIDKSCDPLEADAAGSMTMNCQIEVTGTDLATGSYVLAADMFGALPPMTTTITGAMMNVTSTEPWSCVDQNINNPGSTGVCELTATDMLAAGGASTINVSFDFTASASAGQVVNCPMTDILPASFISAAGQRSAAPAVDAPQSSTIAGLPDNCVVLDLPVSVEPPEFALKKGCRLGGVQDGNAFYACTIYISQSSGASITDPLTFDELFSTTSGSPATQYMLNMQGTPAMPNGWDCQQPPYTNGASCTIAAADFNATPSHRIDAYLSIPTSAFGVEGFENCAQVRIGDQVVGAAECVEVEQPPVETVFDVSKQCKEAGPRQTFGSSVWFQPYQCTLTVATNAAFTGPLWLSENLSFGQNPGASSILNITSADPWTCTSPPYAPAGQGTTPECSIDGAQFPASGHSTLTVDLMMNGAMDMFGAQNCVSIGLGKVVGEGEPLASDCFEIAPPPTPEPALDITKTCAPAVRGGDGIWTAECEINVHFENFDTATNHQFYIYDALGGNGPQTPLTSLMPFNTMGMGGWGPTTGTPAGFNNATGMLLNYLQADGSATITQPYTATFSGPAGQLINGGPITNCAWVTIPTLSLRAPAGPVGDEKVCTPIPFPASATAGAGGIVDPALPDTPVGPIIATGSIGSTRPDIVLPRPETPTPVPTVPRPILTMVKEQTGSCEPDRVNQTYDCGFRLRVTNTGDGTYFGPLVITDTSGAPGMRSAQVVSGGNGWTCGTAVNAALSCSNPALNLAPGASTHIDLRMTVNALLKGGTFQNCAAIGVPINRTERVALIQKLMNDRGLNAGPVDGKAGQKTYTALSKLRSDLGLPDSREFDDELFEALGLSLQDKGAVSCVTATLPAMPAPPLRCDAGSTVQQGESCACRYPNMITSSATSCQCVKGFELIKGKGCVEVITETPAPVPEPALQCDLRSTYERGDICACIDHENAKNISATQCGCTNGLPMINGKCLPVVIKPKVPTKGEESDEKCKIRLNGICIK